MKHKLYTRAHDLDRLSQMGDLQGIFTPEEHAAVIEQEHGNAFTSRESLLRWYFSTGAKKLSALGFLIDRINNGEARAVLSLGAGPCVLEYLLTCTLDPSIKVVATDFDPFYVKRAQELLKPVLALQFDFFQDDPKAVADQLDFPLDLAVFFGSTYVMNDSQFIHLFKRLADMGIQEVIDFQAGYLPYSQASLLLLHNFRNMLRISRSSSTSSLGKFHGYSRTRGELRRLYKEAGWCPIEEKAIAPYKYAAICRRKAA